ncbi:MAG: 16S rRNA (uracil(1498)-N(3))-methyltransferase [Flavobacteriales bacterium]|nr:16S rRNA (uracil(1498)-N(3))-methyltransferase [Flavobacteriales bacterium]
MHLFFCPDLESGLVNLPDEEAHHATQVLRLAVGQRIGLLNGRGSRAEAELVDVSRKRCVAMVLETEDVASERGARIHLAVAHTKQADRFEWFVEKAVEIGIDRITPLATARTERGRARIDRMERVAISALKQSQRAWLPQIDPLTTLGDLLVEALPEQRFFGHINAQSIPFREAYHPEADAILVIGPEGDFTPAEIEELLAHDHAPITLGNARLRTETAAVAACAFMSLKQSG